MLEVPGQEDCTHLDLQSTQHNGLWPKIPGIWTIVLGTLEVRAERCQYAFLQADDRHC